MFLSAIIRFADSQPMPTILELLFLSAGMFFLLVGSFRAWALRREWKRKAGKDRRERFKMSISQRIEIGLYNLGGMTCLAVGYPDWWMRVSFAGLAIVAILVLLYRNNLKAQDTQRYDAGSVLDLKNGRTTPAHE